MQDSRTIPQHQTPIGDWLRAFPPRRWQLLLAAACLAGVYLAGVSAKWWPTPDSAMLMGLGRSLAEGKGYRFNGQTNVHVTPGVPLALAGLRILLGPADWAPNLLLALCGLGAVAMAYLVTARLSDRRLALAVALCTGSSYVFFHNAHRVLTDIPFTLLFWGTLYACLRFGKGSRWWLVPAALLAGAGIAVRVPAVVPLGVLAGAVALGGGLIRPWRRRLAAAATILAATAAACAGFYLLARAATGKTPVYLFYMDQVVPLGPARVLRQTADALVKMPSLLAEILTAQDGAAAAVLTGLPALLLVVLGAVNFWRTGRRDLAGLVVLVPMAMALTCGEGRIRVRYLLPVHALLVYAALEGLLWAVRRLRAAKPTSAKPTRYLVAVTVLTGIVIASNLPRLARDAFYYSYLSRTPRYYQAIREGGHSELFAAADVLRRHCPPDGLVAAPGNMASLLHYLSERVIVDFPGGRGQTAADARSIIDFVVPDEKLLVVVLDLTAGSPAFRGSLRAALDDPARFQPLYAGEHYRLYGRVPAGGG